MTDTTCDDDSLRAQRTASLAAAARARSEAKIAAAEAAIRTLRKRGEPITFQSVGREAVVSHTFLYGNADLRRRIEHLRRQHRRPAQSPAPPGGPADENSQTSTLVAALSAELARLRKAHRDEVTALRAALERAHGENLDLRRELQNRAPL